MAQRKPISQHYSTDEEQVQLKPPSNSPNNDKDDRSIISDLNVYQHKKTLGQGMMDLALFSANVNQLRYVLGAFNTHPYYYPSLVLISISLLVQVAVGIGLIWNATYNLKNQRNLPTAKKINDFTIIGVFLVTVMNCFISTFAVAPALT